MESDPLTRIDFAASNNKVRIKHRISNAEISTQHSVFIIQYYSSNNIHFIFLIALSSCTVSAFNFSIAMVNAMLLNSLMCAFSHCSVCSG